MSERAAVRVGQAFRLLPAALLLCACAGNNTRTYTEGAAIAAPEGTVAVSISRIGEGCRDAARCAEVEAVRALLFTGVPGSAISRALVRNESQALSQHREYFKQLLEDGGHARYIVRASSQKASGESDQNWIIVVNHEALRIALEREGILRRFGY
jgi:hypothetical protein